MEPDQNHYIKEKSGVLKDLFDKAEEYMRTSIELLKLKTLDTGSDLLSLWISRLIVVIFLFMFLFMLNIGIAIWVGGLLGNVSYGFLIVAAFYAVIGLILYFPMGGFIKRRISDYIIKQTLR